MDQKLIPTPNCFSDRLEADRANRNNVCDIAWLHRGSERGHPGTFAQPEQANHGWVDICLRPYERRSGEGIFCKQGIVSLERGITDGALGIRGVSQKSKKNEAIAQMRGEVQSPAPHLFVFILR
jgi:hypothetical protein